MGRQLTQIRLMNDPAVNFILESRKNIYHKKSCPKIWTAIPRSLSGSTMTEEQLQKKGYKPCPARGEAIVLNKPEEGGFLVYPQAQSKPQPQVGSQPPGKPRSKHDIFISAIKTVCDNYGMTTDFNAYSSVVRITFAGQTWTLDFGSDPVILKGKEDLRFDNTTLALEHIYLTGSKTRRVEIENCLDIEIQDSSPREVVLAIAKTKGFDEDALLSELNVRQDEWEYDCQNCFSTMPAGLFESLCDTIGIPVSTLMNVLARLDFEA